MACARENQIKKNTLSLSNNKKCGRNIKTEIVRRFISAIFHKHHMSFSELHGFH